MDRNRKFHKVFKNISPEEILIKSFSCAYVGDILLQGFLYLSDNYFCFYTKILGHSKRIQIPMDKVEKLTREKTAFIIPNAIAIWTSRGEKFVFSSFLARDNTYNLMTTLLEKNRAFDIEKEIQALAHESSKVNQKELNVSVSSSLNKTESSTSSESSIEEPKAFKGSRRVKELFANSRSVSTHTVTAASVGGSTQSPPVNTPTSSRQNDSATLTPSSNAAEFHKQVPTTSQPPLNSTESEELRKSKSILKFIFVLFLILVAMTVILSYKLVRLETIYERYQQNNNLRSNINPEIYKYL